MVQCVGGDRERSLLGGVSRWSETNFLSPRQNLNQFFSLDRGALTQMGSFPDMLKTQGSV